MILLLIIALINLSNGQNLQVKQLPPSQELKVVQIHSSNINSVDVAHNNIDLKVED